MRITDHGLMALMREIEWEACLLEPRRDREVERQVRLTAGSAGSMAYFLDCPWAPVAMARLNRCLFERVHMDPTLGDLISLVVSQDNSCRYCFAVQRVLLQGMGYPKERIERLEREFRTADQTPRDRAALEFARRLSRSNPLPTDADWQTMRAADFEDAAIREIVGKVALMIFFNRVSTLAALQPQNYERLTDRWYTPVLLRVARPYLRRFRQKGAAAELSEVELSGPFSYPVRALNGLPAARGLRDTLREMWDSEILPRRTKAFIFAVVARAIGCQTCEQASIRLLLDEGVDEQTISEVLSHLASPKLDRIESIVLPFVRETVWYEAAPIQRRARQVRDQLTNREFVELIVVASIANAVGRIGIAVGH